MRIQHALIYGFGKWIDYSIDFTPNRLICIYGDNESGKSTLQNFILFMLFGLPPKQRTFYQPKTSGKMGGRLTVLDSKVGTYTIERSDTVKNGAAVCYLPDGRVFDDAWLGERLKGLTSDVYGSVFSFSALDLNDFRAMKDEDLGEVLLGIGLTGSNNIHSIERGLDNKIGALFKPTGKVPIINKQLDSLDQLWTELTKYKENESTYRDKQLEITELTIALEKLQLELNEEQSNLSIIEKQQHVLPAIHDYQNYYKQLMSYPDKIDFPEVGLARLDSLQDYVLPLRSELAVLQVNEEKYVVEYERLLSEITEQQSYEAAKQLIDNKHYYLENKQAILRQQELVKELALQVSGGLEGLDIGVSAEELALINFPFHIEKLWNELKNQLEQLELEKEQLKHEQNSLKQKRMFLMNELQGVEDQLLTSEKLDSLHLQIDTYKETNYMNQLQRASTKKHELWKESKKVRQSSNNNILIGSIIAALLAGLSAKLFNIPFLYNLMLVLPIVGVSLWVWGKKTIRETDAILSPTDKSEISTHITAEEKQYAEELLSEDERRRSNQHSINDQLKSTDIEWAKWRDKENLLEKREEQLHKEIAIEHSNYPFLHYIKIVYWPELLHTVKSLMKIVREKKKNEEIYDLLESKRVVYSKDIERVSEQIKEGSISRSFDYQLGIIQDMVDSYQEKNRSKEQYIRLIHENKEQQLETERQIEVYVREINLLFRDADVETEDEFYIKARQSEKKLELQDAIEKIENQLSMNFSRSVWEELTEKELEETSLEASKQQAKLAIKLAEENIDENRQQLADLKANISFMESSELYSSTIHQYNMEQEELLELAKKWAVLTTAKEMLAETKRKYRDKYLSRVIDKTSNYFSKVTGNNYQSVFAPSDGKVFQVEAIDGVRYRVNELSQGTIDQLYISLRLAISEIMSEAHQLPFIIDDAFVHFDKVRTKRMMSILADVAIDQQIIVFTCKREVIASVEASQVIYLEEPVYT